MRLLISILVFSCLNSLNAYANELGRDVLYEHNSKLYLNAHNKFRVKNGLKPYQWSDQLAIYAQNFAHELAEFCKIYSSNHLHYSENIAYRWGSIPFTPTMAVESWIDDSDSYDRYEKKCLNDKQCNSFLNVISENTKLVGCGMAYCREDITYEIRTIHVCEYFPIPNGKITIFK